MIEHNGRTAWLHRTHASKAHPGGEADNGRRPKKATIYFPWRAKIERYRNDIIYFNGNIPLEEAIEQVKRFIDTLDARIGQYGFGHSFRGNQYRRNPQTLDTKL